jgi:valyl-tRNA synthetase
MANGDKDFEEYFPTQVMETGWDILFFWVARMIMLSYYRTKTYPFEKVYLHGLVRDAKGQKISKSKGNAISPHEMIDKYGTDAVRVALIFSTSAGNDIPLAEDKIRGMKHFANKLWNISRYVLMSVTNEDIQKDSEGHRPEPKTEADKYILERLSMMIQSVTASLEKFDLHKAIQDIYHFTWHEFADKYLEASKDQLQDPHLSESTRAILAHILIRTLKLLHPFAPFVTEKIWEQMFGTDKKQLLMVQNWPE